MKITKRQLSLIINEYYGSGIMDVPEDATPYERGYDDWSTGVDSGTEPEMPDDPEYMRGWEDADLASRVKETEPPFRGPDPETHRRLRQQSRAQGGYGGKGAWKSRTPNE